MHQLTGELSQWTRTEAQSQQLNIRLQTLFQSPVQDLLSTNTALFLQAALLLLPRLQSDHSLSVLEHLVLWST